MGSILYLSEYYGEKSKNKMAKSKSTFSLVEVKDKTENRTNGNSRGRGGHGSESASSGTLGSTYSIPRPRYLGNWNFNKGPRLGLRNSTSTDSIFHAQNKTDKILRKLDDDVIGGGASGFMGPFGWKKYTYVDHTASGKSLRSIESFIERQVLPNYANTHTTVSHSSLQTTVFRDEARKIIRNSVGATNNDEVIFCGSGATACVHKLLHLITPPTKSSGSKSSLAVFIGPMEHHSNILPWRENAKKVIQVPLDSSTGRIDLRFLEKQLKLVSKKKKYFLIGCFSAGSNITGSVPDDLKITQMLHSHGALAVWDYAAAAPHVPIKMNPNSQNSQCSSSTSKDAIFFSGHKFLGGPQTPGVLVIKKSIVTNAVPHGAGGGTVLFTTRKNHQYLKEIHEREEGGTPNIVGAIRLGLVFQLRNSIGIEVIMRKEAEYCRRVLEAWSEIPEIIVLGSGSRNCENPRLPIISFMIRHRKSGYFLHHDYVVAVLNDLFGIQCRGGCMCAGPYAQALLGINDELASQYEGHLEKATASNGIGNLLKPGFTRVSVSYHSSSLEVDFLIGAVQLVAKFGWRLLPYYRISTEDSASFVFNGELFRSKKGHLGQRSTPITNLSSWNLDNENDSHLKEVQKVFDYEECLKQAEYFMCHNHAFSRGHDLHSFPAETPSGLEHHGHLRWFMLPFESILWQNPGAALHHKINRCLRCPFQPLTFDPLDIHPHLQQLDGNQQDFGEIQSISGMLAKCWNLNYYDYDHSSGQFVTSTSDLDPDLLPELVMRYWEMMDKSDN